METKSVEELIDGVLDKPKPEKGIKKVIYNIIETLDTAYWTIRRWWTDNFIMFFKRCFWKIKYGFDITETWNLDYSLCKWLLPRLKYFKEHTIAFPAHKDLFGQDFTEETWNAYLEHMIFWCECNVNDDVPCYIPENFLYGTEEDQKKKERYDLGKQCFDKYFDDLWW